MRRSSSTVEAWEKKAVWGVMMMFLALRRGWSSGGGAGSTTSRPAPARWPLLRASARACSWMMPPRAQLTMIPPGIIIANWSAPIMPSVSGVSGVWTVMKWERRRTSSNEMISTPSMDSTRFDEWVVRNYVHPEADRFFGDGASDTSEAEDA